MMKKTVKVLVVVSMLCVMLPISPAQACACGGVPDWSRMSVEQIVSFVNGIDGATRIRDAQQGYLPPAPPGYRYTNDYELVPLSTSSWVSEKPLIPATQFPGRPLLGGS